MVVSESALLKMMEKAYKGSGYHVAVGNTPFGYCLAGRDQIRARALEGIGPNCQQHRRDPGGAGHSVHGQ